MPSHRFNNINAKSAPSPNAAAAFAISSAKLDGGRQRGRERASPQQPNPSPQAATRAIRNEPITIPSMTIVKVRQARRSDRNELAKMQALLWPGASPDELLKELDDALSHRTPGTLPTVLLVATDADGAFTGFLELGLRSHADGCDPAQPVGFVEGWFVHENFRNQGVGKALLHSAEEWAAPTTAGRWPPTR